MDKPKVHDQDSSDLDLGKMAHAHFIDLKLFLTILFVIILGILITIAISLFKMRLGTVVFSS